MNLKTAVEHIKIPFALSLSKGERGFDMLTKWVRREIRSCFDKLSTNGFHAFQLPFLGLTVDLSDGRSITVPLAWYPRLINASKAELDNWRLVGKGYGIHSEDIDEDVSIEGLFLGKPSGESQASFKKWLLSVPVDPTSKKHRPFDKG